MSYHEEQISFSGFVEKSDASHARLLEVDVGGKQMLARLLPPLPVTAIEACFPFGEASSTEFTVPPDMPVIPADGAKMRVSELSSYCLLLLHRGGHVDTTFIATGSIAARDARKKRFDERNAYMRQQRLVTILPPFR